MAGLRHRAQIVLFTVAVSLALIVLAMAWPRLQAALEYLPVEAAIDRYHLDGQVPLDSLENLLDRARRSIEQHPQSRYWNGLAVLSYLQALDDRAPLARRREAFEQTTQAARQSLLLAPVQPRTWLYLALAQSSLSFRGADSIAPLKMSIYTGRVEPALLLSRLQLAYARFAQLDEEARGLLRDQTLLTFRLKPREFIGSVKAGDIDFQRVSSLLGPVAPGVLQEMEGSLAGHVR
ncbi:MAG: hypothetical protein RQ826_06925 [Xanthomonadales bacterium]|nr:hypothetical protein [Xanthomonadales bacterium]